jgi:hypothetical protein
MRTDLTDRAWFGPQLEVNRFDCRRTGTEMRS